MQRLIIAALFFLLLASSLPPRTSLAAPSPDPFSGRYLELSTEFTTWDEGRVAAAALVFDGVPGHLPTVFSARENQVFRFLGGALGGWVGLTDSEEMSDIDGFDLSLLGTSEEGDTSALPLPGDGMSPTAGERGAGWRWITGEAFTFQNWGTDAPSDGLLIGGADAASLHSSGFWFDGPAGLSLGQAGAPGTNRYYVEYDTVLDQSKFSIFERKASASFLGDGFVSNLTEAKTLLDLPMGDAGIAAEASAETFVVSFHDPEFTGGQVGLARTPFLTDGPGNDDQFALRATAEVVIPSAGNWTFAVAHGGNFELLVGDNSFTSFFEGNPLLARTALGTLSVPAGGSGDVFFFPTAGVYDLTLTMQEGSSAAFLQLLAAPGDHAVFDAGAFKLVGDELNGGLALVPEPASALLLGLGLTCGGLVCLGRIGRGARLARCKGV